MKKTQIDKCAYYWACKLLPDHIEKLKEQLKDADEYESICMNDSVSRAEDELEEITKRYENLKSRGVR